ncbi:uncharacterized protein LACBIDRAFT_319081 [Laccaria bicolor S238N-H82]|uniref:Predicted protein n=1 Tax=Laccaria bicolor (strain S238N-H82 / ATCC MYA-4686) TaxID=486041 RepID=B0D7U1_LACBS|nr:uncharacterized protein LACBIDRAFT_319081 [Laccaria bicolor S238N-H82]EDR09460.1 predicted protein [Laccaria bicolor S238N-H82]|eukprot:XP_001879809.1 predicted protein [Laccaria bicolor S238N-H82]
MSMLSAVFWPGWYRADVSEPEQKVQCGTEYPRPQGLHGYEGGMRKVKAIGG